MISLSTIMSFVTPSGTGSRGLPCPEVLAKGRLYPDARELPLQRDGNYITALLGRDKPPHLLYQLLGKKEVGLPFLLPAGVLFIHHIYIYYVVYNSVLSTYYTYSNSSLQLLNKRYSVIISLARAARVPGPSAGAPVTTATPGNTLGQFRANPQG